MEYAVALLALFVAVGYAVFIAVNIEKGKPWALEISRTVSMLNPNGRDHSGSFESEQPVEEVEAEDLPEPERLAA